MPVAGADAAVAGRHILLTGDAVGGVWTYALDLARGLAALGARTTLAVLGPGPAPDQVADADAVPGLALLVTGLPLEWTVASRDAALAANADLAALAARTGADLVHLHAPALAAGARPAGPVVATCHSCLRTWWDAVRGSPLPPDFAWRAELVREGCLVADALTAPTSAFAAATAATYGLARAPTVVRNGRGHFVDGAAPQTLSPSGRGRAAKRPGKGVAPSRMGPQPPHPSLSGSGRGFPRWSLERERAGDGVSAFTAGRLWDEGKNVAVIDEAAAGCGIPVLAAGPLAGPNGARIALRNAVSVGRLGPEAVAAQLACRPIFVSSALYEPFGLSVLEAAGAACALVLSDIPTFRELWEGAALFVAPRDAAALASALRRLAADPDERDRLGALAAERAGRYGLDAFVGGTVAVYRDALRRGGTQRTGVAA